MSCIITNCNQTLPGGSGHFIENIDFGAGTVCTGGFGVAATGYCYTYSGDGPARVACSPSPAHSL